MWDIIPVTYKKLPNLEFFKIGLKNGNLRTTLADFARHTLVESVLYKKY